MLTQKITENAVKPDLKVNLSAEDLDGPSKSAYSIENLGMYCRRGSDRLAPEQIQSLNATFWENLMNLDSAYQFPSGFNVYPLRACGFSERNKFRISKRNSGIMEVYLLKAFDFEQTSLYLLVFGVRPAWDGCSRNITDIAFLIFEVENVQEAPTITDCVPPNGMLSPSLSESNEEVESICNLEVTFQDPQKYVECNVKETGRNATRFILSVLEKNEGEARNMAIHIQEAANSVKLAGWRVRFGLIKPGVVVDYESERNLSIEFICTNKYHNASKWIVVHVKDVNDAPRFQRDRYELSFSEGFVRAENLSATRLEIAATDEDEGDILHFSILSSKCQPKILSLFQIDEWQGVLTAKIGAEFDREETELYWLTVMVQDKTIPVKSAKVQVEVHILDNNDNPPTFILPPQSNASPGPAISIELPCNLKSPTFVYRVEATDPDLKDAGIVKVKLVEQTIAYENGGVVNDPDNGKLDGRMRFTFSESSGDIHLQSDLSCWDVGYVVTMVIAANDNAWPYHRAHSNLTVSIRLFDVGPNKRSMLHLAIISFAVFLINSIVGFNICRRVRSFQLASLSSIHSSPSGSSSVSDSEGDDIGNNVSDIIASNISSPESLESPYSENPENGSDSESESESSSDSEEQSDVIESLSDAPRNSDKDYYVEGPTLDRCHSAPEFSRGAGEAEIIKVSKSCSALTHLCRSFRPSSPHRLKLKTPAVEFCEQLEEKEVTELEGGSRSGNRVEHEQG